VFTFILRLFLNYDSLFVEFLEYFYCMKFSFQRFFLQRYRAFLESFYLFRQNAFISFGIFLATSIILFLFNILIATGFGVITNIENIHKNIGIEVDMKENTDIEALSKLMFDLRSLSGVNIKISTQEENLEKFLNRHEYLRNFIEKTDIQPLSSTLLITSTSLDQYDHILAILEDVSYVNLLHLKDALFYQQQKDQIQKIVNIASSVKIILQILGMFFVCLFIIIYIHAQLLALSRFSKEIMIKKIIGAHLSFIREPFLWYSSYIVAMSVLFGYILFFFVLKHILEGQYIFSPQLLITEQHVWSFFQENIYTILGFEMIFSLLLALFTTLITLAFYLFFHNKYD
jgi:cell division protein FtsX